MQDFLNKLYSYEYFGTYLMIAIAVLILLFVIILFFGKKDQKKREIEETKKLQQINNVDAFKEENTEVKAEGTLGVVEPPADNLDNTVIVPNIEDINPVINVNDSPDVLNNLNPSEPVIPNIVDNENNILEAPSIPSANEVESLTAEVNENSSVNNASSNVSGDNNEPLLDRVEEQPLVFNEDVTPSVDVPEFNLDEIIRGVEDTKEDDIKPTEVSKIEMPTMSDLEVSDNKPKEVFSSVFVESIPTSNANEEVKYDEDDEEDFELPALKKDLKEETQNIELPNLSDLSGESYNIK